MNSNTRLPTFIVIGPGRTATTMLYEAFKEHPEICTAKNTKETNFFNHNYDKGLQWYQAFFRHCDNAKAIGEICNTYIYDPDLPSRIAKDLPDVKLITVLRNPFDRIRSAYDYRKRSGEIDARLSIQQAIEAYPDLVTQNFYADQLSGYIEHFSRKNLLIAFYDDLKAQPETFIRALFGFINVRDDFIPQALFQQINPAVAVRHRYQAGMSRIIAESLRSLQFYWLLDIAKRSSIINKIMFSQNSDKVSNIDAETIEKLLSDEFIPQIQAIESITGRSLIHWYEPQ